MKKLLSVIGGLLVGLAVLQAADPPQGTEDADSDVQDVVYTGEGRLAFLRLHVRVDGRPLFAHWEAYIEKVFQFLDRNHSNNLDRTEAARAPVPQQLQGYFQGNVNAFAPRGQNPTSIPFEALDTDGDGRVSLEELRDYYRKNGAGPVQVAAQPSNRAGTDVLSDTLFNLFDANKDGKLSKDEVELAQELLIRYDSNDNELVSQGELGGGGEAPQQRQAVARMTPEQPPPPTPLILISREDSGKRMTGRLGIARELMTRLDKDKNNRLSQSESGFPEEMFARLDRNKDGQLDTLELVRWLTGKPDGEYLIPLGYGTGPRPTKAQEGRRRVAAVKAPAGTEMALSLGRVRLSVVPVGAMYVMPDNTRFIMDQFKQLDREKKGFLARTRVGQEHFYLNPVFDVADRNADGRLTEGELKNFLALIRAGAGMQVSFTLTSTGQGLFQTLDADGDGQLSIREMRNAWKRMSVFDTDGDGHVSRTEFPLQFRLAVGTMPYYGFAVQADGGVEGMAPRRMTTRGPLWFRKMDTNGDGDVSRREWLGSKEDFDRIDIDKDGLISPDEAEAADAATRRNVN